MTNPKLADDYLKRAQGRRKALQTLLGEDLFADVVREAQEACELAFYGSEDITPSEFYTRDDADRAIGMLDEVLAAVAIRK